MAFDDMTVHYAGRVLQDQYWNDVATVADHLFKCLENEDFGEGQNWYTYYNRYIKNHDRSKIVHLAFEAIVFSMSNIKVDELVDHDGVVDLQHIGQHLFKLDILDRLNTVYDVDTDHPIRHRCILCGSSQPAINMYYARNFAFVDCKEGWFCTTCARELATCARCQRFTIKDTLRPVPGIIGNVCDDCRSIQLGLNESLLIALGDDGKDRCYYCHAFKPNHTYRDCEGNNQ